MALFIRKVHGGRIDVERCERVEYAVGDYFGNKCNYLSIDVVLGACKFSADLILPNYGFVLLHPMLVTEGVLSYGKTWLLRYVGLLPLFYGTGLFVWQRGNDYFDFGVLLPVIGGVLPEVSIEAYQYFSYRGNNNSSAMPPPFSSLL